MIVLCGGSSIPFCSRTLMAAGCGRPVRSPSGPILRPAGPSRGSLRENQPARGSSACGAHFHIKTITIVKTVQRYWLFLASAMCRSRPKRTRTLGRGQIADSSLRDCSRSTEIFGENDTCCKMVSGRNRDRFAQGDQSANETADNQGMGLPCGPTFG